MHGDRKAATDKTTARSSRQRTLKSTIACTGVALHSGIKVSMTLKPAAANHGIVFKRTDIKGKGAFIPARWDHVVDTRMCSVLGNADGVTVGTVEHLMAALAGCRIDNALVEINGSEVPVMDGSASPFVFLIECAGVVEQDAPRRAIRILRPVIVKDGDRIATLLPASSFTVDFEIDFRNTAVSRQALGLALVDGAFKKELARARTFGFLHEVEALWAMGLARGGSLDNAVVVSGEKILNEDGLRYEDEFVRHKILDAVGDLYLAGAPIVGHFRGVCTGHAHTNRLLRELLANPDAWCWEEARDSVALAPQRPAAFALAANG
ncbi:MAG: UDP-3-O-acyl-N-acetylglucosamine deacetylase [Magnetospirillum sp. WYHS-4]